jgi:succinate dehydrogenase / fumarate reductase, cytochrome b subunit
MSIKKSYLGTTLGRKYLVGLTGFFWALFVMVHMLGNLLIFYSAEAYNKYSHALISNPFIYVAETLLVVLLLCHVVFALSLKLRNLRTNPTHYAVTPVKDKSASVSSRSMAYTGLAILGFLIWHIATMKFGPEYITAYDGVRMRDLYTLVIDAFHNPLYVFLYCVSIVMVGTHLFHGVKSSFQTFGLLHPRYNNFIQCFGRTYAIVVAVGFLVLPLYVYSSSFFVR